MTRTLRFALALARIAARGLYVVMVYSFVGVLFVILCAVTLPSAILLDGIDWIAEEWAKSK